jgi:hypothetical protein
MRIAHAAGKQLRMVAKLPRGERRYVKERLEPQIDGTQFRFIGEPSSRFWPEPPRCSFRSIGPNRSASS